MEGYIQRHYKLFFSLLMAAIVGLAFYVGMLEGKQVQGSTVTLSCTDDVLASLAIPTKTLSGASTKASDLAASATPLIETTKPISSGKYAGSKNGTKYYAPGCPGLDRIKPENIIWFQSAEDATLQGYTEAKC